MTARLVLNNHEDWLLPGSPDDSRLFHADPSDQILVYPAHAGQGYRQKIQLRDELTLSIMDYELSSNVVLNAPGNEPNVRFEFPLINTGTRRSEFVPMLGFRVLSAAIAQQRIFEIEVVFKGTSILTYAQACLERFPLHARRIAEDIVKSLWRFQGGRPGLDTAEMMRRMAKYATQGTLTSYGEITLGHILSDTLYAETVDLQYANRTLITPRMEKIMGQILSCPYQGSTRRRYLERKALELVMLRLQAITPPRLNQTDLSCIYQAAALLRSQVVNPPTVEELARKVGTNRLKLNQGFHEVYGTTPFKYLRDCRLGMARRLLTTSDMPVETIAAEVGYRSRNHFAKAFRRQVGLNPKAFQMQVWQWAS